MRMYIFQVVNDLKADQKVVDRLLDASMRFAASRSATKTFHCITPDCTHWWFIEPEQANDIIRCDVNRKELINYLLLLFHRVVNIGFVLHAQ